jgi:2-amino-4-hydroxy-6-hydroxymethyldihydropteridine diphosphokinase
LGSNLGDRLANLRDARSRIAALDRVEVRDCAPVYETEPVDVRGEYADLKFLNTVLIVVAALSPETLSARLHAIEASMGRVRTGDPNAPRPIDIDILYIDRFTIARPELTVPHPSWAKRRFVVQPLADVRPCLRLPGFDQTVAGVLSSLPLHDEVVLLRREW